ncbi:MAG: 50S ribosomal protein L23 [Chitinophagales bacterium]|jgi:large subunit ribosomal protein L23|nr:50S ribosomal protein L23 [Chitinophagales bacterium]
MSAIIIKPLVTEKTDKLGKLNRYTFKVDRDANRLEIKKAIETLYNVKVADVNTAVIPGKAKMRYTKKGFTKGIKSAYKKAYITLKEGETLDIYATV